MRRFSLTSAIFVLSLVSFPLQAYSGPRGYTRTRIVSPVPGDPVLSGNRLLNALATVAGATAADPWLVVLEPGIYDVGGTTVAMIAFVDLEGSGSGVTTITGLPASAPTVEGAADAALRDITVEHRGNGASSVAIRNAEDRFRIERVRAIGHDGASAFSNTGSATRVSDLDAQALAIPAGGGAITNFGVEGVWKGVSATAIGSGIIYAILNYTDSDFSEVDARAESATAFAGGIRNESGSPIMRDVRAYAKGTTGQAITNGAGSNAKLYDVSATAIATTDFAVGVSNQFGSPLLKNADVSAEGVTGAYGVASLLGADVTMDAVRAVAKAAGFGAGLLTDASASEAHSSSFEGDGYSVDNRFDVSAVSKLGASQLIGSVRAGMGILRCVASYDGGFNPLTAACTP